MWCGSHDGEVVLAQKVLNLSTGSFDDRNREEGTGGGADDIGVVDIGTAVADYDTIDSSGIGGTQDGAQIAGFFDRLCHHQEGVVRQFEVIQGLGKVGANHE